MKRLIFALCLLPLMAQETGKPKPVTVESLQKQLAASQAEAQALREHIAALQQWQMRQIAALNGALNGCVNSPGQPPQAPPPVSK